MENAVFEASAASTGETARLPLGASAPEINVLPFIKLSMFFLFGNNTDL